MLGFELWIPHAFNNCTISPQIFSFCFVGIFPANKCDFVQVIRSHLRGGSEAKKGTSDPYMSFAWHEKWEIMRRPVYLSITEQQSDIRSGVCPNLSLAGWNIFIARWIFCRRCEKMSRHAERLNPQRAALNTRRINLFLQPAPGDHKR